MFLDVFWLKFPNFWPMLWPFMSWMFSVGIFYEFRMFVLFNCFPSLPISYFSEFHHSPWSKITLSQKNGTKPFVQNVFVACLLCRKTILLAPTTTGLHCHYPIKDITQNWPRKARRKAGVLPASRGWRCYLRAISNALVAFKLTCHCWLIRMRLVRILSPHAVYVYCLWLQVNVSAAASRFIWNFSYRTSGCSQVVPAGYVRFTCGPWSKCLWLTYKLICLGNVLLPAVNIKNCLRDTLSLKEHFWVFKWNLGQNYTKSCVILPSADLEADSFHRWI